MANRHHALNFHSYSAHQIHTFFLQLPSIGVACFVLATVLWGCSPAAEFKSEQFVGSWKSSRLNSRPVHLMANGEWEIRADDGGKPLQFGVWEVKVRTLTWTIRIDKQLTHDRNRIESYAPNRFTLREQDGSLTTFDRLN